MAIDREDLNRVDDALTELRSSYQSHVADYAFTQGKNSVKLQTLAADIDAIEKRITTLDANISKGLKEMRALLISVGKRLFYTVIGGTIVGLALKFSPLSELLK